MYKTEAHIHTLPSSSCAKHTPREMVRLHKDAGYDTVILSDHFAAHHFRKLGDELSFADKVELMWQSYLEAKDEGEKLGVTVLFSVELSLGGNHYLLYPVTVEFLRLREDVFEMSLEDFHAHAKQHGITLIQAHPYRDGKNQPQPRYADGFEVINTNPRHENFTAQTIAFAEAEQKPMTCGSDAHRVEDVGGCAILSEERITSIEQYLALLMAGKLTLSVTEEKE